MEERQKEGSIGVTPHRMSKGNGSCVRWMKLRGESVWVDVKSRVLFTIDGYEDRQPEWNGILMKKTGGLERFYPGRGKWEKKNQGQTQGVDQNSPVICYRYIFASVLASAEEASVVRLVLLGAVKQLICIHDKDQAKWEGIPKFVSPNPSVLLLVSPLGLRLLWL